MDILPPLKLLKQWREAGLSPQEIYQRCEAIEEARQEAKRKSKRKKSCRGSPAGPPCECGGQHYAKGKCYRCYQREYMRKRKKDKMTIQIMPGVKRLKGGKISPTDVNNSGKLAIPDKSLLSPPQLPVPGQKDACYKSACLLAHLIDVGLESERVHFRNRAGELLETLDQVVAAILTGELLEPGEVASGY